MTGKDVHEAFLNWLQANKSKYPDPDRSLSEWLPVFEDWVAERLNEKDKTVRELLRNQPGIQGS